MAKKSKNGAMEIHEGEMVTRAIEWLFYRKHEKNNVSLAKTIGASSTTITLNKRLAKVPPGFLYNLETKALKPHGVTLQDFIAAGNPEGPEDATRMTATTNLRMDVMIEKILGIVTDLKEENKKLKMEVAKLSHLISKKSAS